jgi:hypothetical protein
MNSAKCSDYVSFHWICFCTCNFNVALIWKFFAKGVFSYLHNVAVKTVNNLSFCSWWLPTPHPFFLLTFCVCKFSRQRSTEAFQGSTEVFWNFFKTLLVYRTLFNTALRFLWYAGIDTRTLATLVLVLASQTLEPLGKISSILNRNIRRIFWKKCQVWCYWRAWIAAVDALPASSAPVATGKGIPSCQSINK